LINREDIYQSAEQIIDIADWPVHEDYEVFPIGARDKSLRICPSNSPSFCIAGHRYLFKEAIKSAKDPSKPKFPDQYWSEIIAFKIGRLMKLSIPPVFAAFNSDTGQPGALVEWFTGYPNQASERFTPGGDHMQRLIENYDRDKGRKHNLQTIVLLSKALTQSKWLNSSWIEYWGLCLCYDAVIGNTDRHQENWGILWDDDTKTARFSPYFDNGTSLGHEIPPIKFPKFRSNSDMLDGYIRRGRHQMRWALENDVRLPLIQGVVDYAKEYPSVTPSLIDSLAWSEDELEQSLTQLVSFDIKSPLTEDRAAFVLFLASHRRALLTELLEKLRVEAN